MGQLEQHLRETRQEANILYVIAIISCIVSNAAFLPITYFPNLSTNMSIGTQANIGAVACTFALIGFVTITRASALYTYLKRNSASIV